MADKLKEIPAKILEWWNKFTTRQKSIIVGAAAVVIFAFAIIMYVMSKPQYVRLITCETTSQASEIIDTLDSAGIAHKESNDGLKIDVESSQQSAANLALGSAGYVPDALDLNDYLGGSMSTTATDKERLYNSYLEKYITQTIEAQSAVKSAKVHLSFPKDNGTLAAQKEEASAFIQLELDGTFTSANAAALAKCVATWLRNDTTANITIMDTDSNLLFAGGDDYSTAGIANSMQELQNQAESMIANQVKKVLLGTKQYNDAAVTSHLSMDFSDYKETVKEYYANSGRDEGMLSHEETYESENTNDGGGVPGTTSNGESGNTTYVSPDSSNSSSSTSETSRDYLPNESIKDTVTPAGGINYTNSSISIAAITYKEIHYEDVSTPNAVHNSIYRRCLNGRAFLNDPDVFLLRRTNIKFTVEQQKLLAKFIKLFGSVLFMSDNIADYDSDQLETFKDVLTDDAKILAINEVNDIVFIDYSQNNKEHTLKFNVATGDVY